MKSRAAEAAALPGDPPAGSVADAVRIVLAEDHIFVRELILDFLSREPRYQVVAEVGTARDAVSACQEFSPDILVLDIGLPGESGLEAVPRLRRLCPKTRILLCSGSVTDEQVIEALRSGIDGFMEKTARRDAFLEALAHVARGEKYFCPRSSRLLSEIAQGMHPEAKEEPSILSAREKEILVLIATGHTSKEVASRLHLAVGTVDTHRTNLMRKLGVRNVADMIRYALQQGLIKHRR